MMTKWLLSALVLLLLAFQAQAQVTPGQPPIPPTLNSMGMANAWTTNPSGASATFSNTKGGVNLKSVDVGADNINSICRVVPTPPYFIVAGFAMAQTTWETGDSYAGMVFRDSTSGKLIGWGVVSQPPVPETWAINYSDPATYGGSATGHTRSLQLSGWLALADDGTNVSYWLSQDGISFVRIATTTKAGGYLGSTGYKQIGVFVSAHGSDATVTFFDWRVYAKAPGNITLYIP